MSRPPSSQSLFQDLSRLHRPENQVEFIEINSHAPCESPKALFGFKVPCTSGWRIRRVHNAELRETPHDMLVKNRVTLKANVAKKVAGFLITKSLDTWRSGQPVPARGRVAEALEPLA